MDHADRLRQAMGACPDLRSELGPGPWRIESLSLRRLDGSYPDFLQEQVELAARGPEWTERLVARRAALDPYRERELLCATVRVGEVEFLVEVDLEGGTVVHWERY